jgi:hypothetical protein
LIQIRKQSDEVMKAKVEIINCINVKPKKVKRVSKIRDVEAVGVTILVFLGCHSSNINIFVCIS